MTEKKSAQPRILKGIVVSDKMDKTVVVRVDRFKLHRLYKKQYKVSKRYKAHDAKGEAHVGDAVRICQIRPMSKDKRWMVVSESRQAEAKGDPQS